jgi:hypothetical protein
VLHADLLLSLFRFFGLPPFGPAGRGGNSESSLTHRTEKTITRRLADAENLEQELPIF